jgi:colanic acid biosynthesis glycosyl transferase WcaI
MNIIFLNRYFAPDHAATSQILSDLAFELGERDWRVAVITSRQLYDAPRRYLSHRETIAGVKVYRVWTSRFGRNNLAGRSIDYMTFYFSAAWQLWRMARQGDIIVAKTDPPMLSVIAAPVAWLRRAHLINWLQDLFPEVAQALGVGSKKWLRAAFRLMILVRNWSLRRASVNVAIGNHMAKHLEDIGIARDRIRVIPNWADGKLVRPQNCRTNNLRHAWDLQHHFVVGYSGNLGRAHDFDTLLGAIALLESGSEREAASGAIGPISAPISQAAFGVGPQTEPKVAWLFVGGGALRKKFEAAILSRGLKSTHFRAYQLREHLNESLSVPDVHIVSLRPEMEGLIVPSKYYGIAAAGRPTIFIGDEGGEIAHILNIEQCGWTIRPGNAVALAELVTHLAANPKLVQEMGQRARVAFEREFDFPIAANAWEALLREINLASADALRGIV